MGEYLGRRIGLGLLCLVCFVLYPTDAAALTGGQAEVEQTEEPPLVALTFDDGPRPDTTGPLLEGLAQRELPATFFLVGERLPGNEDLLKQMKAGGHQIGVHTYHHVNLTGLNREQYEAEVGNTRALLCQTLGGGDYWLRPPYGLYDEHIRTWADSPLILWSVDPEDWRDQDRERIVQHVLSRARDGDIILLHDIYHSSVQAALEIADGLLDRGFCFVTVEQLLSAKGIEPVPGERVTRVLSSTH